MERGDYTNTCLLSFPPCKIFIFGIFVFPGKCAVINNNNSFSFFGGQKKIKNKNSILFFKIKTLKIFFFHLKNNYAIKNKILYINFIFKIYLKI